MRHTTSFEEITFNNYQWPNERNPSNKVENKFDVDALTFLTTKMDVVTQRLDRLNVNTMNACVPSPPRDSC